MDKIKSILKRSSIIRKNKQNFKTIQKNYEIIIHIGAPKSGTSALQKFFLSNRESLLKKGLYYPEHGLGKNNISGGHSLLAIALMENRLDDAKIMFDTWYKKAKELNKILFLSSESFFNLTKEMEPLLKNKKILVIAYHRDISEYIISVHNQLVKRHFLTKTLKQYIETLLKDQNNPSLVNKPFPLIYEEWTNLIGKKNLIVRYYKKECFKNNKIEKDFMDRLGLDTNYLELEKEKINVSYTKEALELKRMINFVLDTRESFLNSRIEAYLQSYSHEENKKYEINFFDTVDREYYKALELHFKEDEKIIKDKYLENYVEFSPDDIKSIKSKKESLLNILLYLLEDQEIKEYLIESTLKTLNRGIFNYSIFKLAELLKLEFLEEYVQSSEYWFRKKQLNNMSEGKYQEVDFLRDIAIILVNRNEMESAKKIIKRALTLRPNGPKIIEISNLINEKNK